MKFAFPSHVDDSYLVTGTAKLTLRMTNMRADYLIYFFTSNWEGYSYQTIDFGVGKYSGYLSYPDQVLPKCNIRALCRSGACRGELLKL